MSARARIDWWTLCVVSRVGLVLDRWPLWLPGYWRVWRWCHRTAKRIRDRWAAPQPDTRSLTHE